MEMALSDSHLGVPGGHGMSGENVLGPRWVTKYVSFLSSRKGIKRTNSLVIFQVCTFLKGDSTFDFYWQTEQRAEYVCGMFQILKKDRTA